MLWGAVGIGVPEAQVTGPADADEAGMDMSRAWSGSWNDQVRWLGLPLAEDVRGALGRRGVQSPATSAAALGPEAAAGAGSWLDLRNQRPHWRLPEAGEAQ